MKKYEEAEQDYLAGMKYKDIAEKYKVTLNTVKSWKSRYWNASKKVATPQKSVHTKTKKVAHKNELHPAIQELEDSDLNDKQKAFVREFVRLANQTQAYINAYDVDYETAMVNASRLLRNAKIQDEIKRLRTSRLEELSVGVFDLLDDLAKEARADIGNYVEFGSYDVLSKGQEGKIELDVDDNPIVNHMSWIQVKDKSKVDTSLIKKINKGKDGLVVELHDRNKARDTLLDWMLKKGRFSNDEGNGEVNITLDKFIPGEEDDN
ncbi:terminase small subunit [Convivina intestini]|uniref:terminase small subunit n=1 Tax=Convivina intestini TaxID=1505726 RepID=UPI0020109DC7|nr:terminase small subunit [Convivina intestini]CAH1853768.1 hypothetical protein R078131_00833 [Convivina intestini]